MSIASLLKAPSSSWSHLTVQSLDADVDLRCVPITTAQRNAITAATGMFVFNSSTNVFEGYNGSWHSIESGATGGTGPTGTFGVASFDGRTGTVLSATGDYNAGQVTASPTGASWPVGDTNVQKSLYDLWLNALPPSAVAERVGGTAGTGATAWIASGCVYQAADSRPSTPVYWVAATGGVQDVRPSITGRNLMSLSATLILTTPPAGLYGVRMLKNGAPNIISEAIRADDGLGSNVTVTTACTIIGAVNDVYTAEIFNNGHGNAAVQRVELDLINFGAV